ncbi:ketosamine-3-kinase-like isoform X2 [Electrophorus electricus]|uniref:ketosamine-3-kinase-like isoform X2 n=1 Tax=Electrophorus electricus TaxID=8005 RepID=UPI0015D08A79|nr:ketosamine-3-kinase-like isoform X2 [Electrophorus electricus]
MEALLKRELGTAKLKATGHSGGGCISEGLSYDTDFGRVFAKINYKNQARQMFDGEKASLEAILSTNAIKAPRPMKVVDLNQGGAVFVMEHVDMRLLSRYSAQLGEQLADLHLHNKRQKEKQIKAEQTIGKGSGQSEVPVVDRFGFHVVTCCGYIPQVNDWQTDWVSFYTQQRLQHQLGLVEQAYGDREARELWASLQCFPIQSSRTPGRSTYFVCPIPAPSLPAEGPAAVLRRGGGACVAPRRPVERQCGRLLGRPHHL